MWKNYKKGFESRSQLRGKITRKVLKVITIARKNYKKGIESRSQLRGKITRKVLKVDHNCKEKLKERF